VRPFPVRRGKRQEKAKALSNPDSFIDEVTEEVRRDRLFRLFRKYGWIGVVIILGLVGGPSRARKPGRRPSATG